MTIRIKPLTKAQLAQYFTVYREAFSEWTVEHDVTLTRTHGPVKQIVAIESLRDGSYRPSCCIRVAGPPGGSQLLFRFLDIKHRQILPRQHASMWPRVIEAMEQQFLPPVRKPLDLSYLLCLAEEDVVRDRIENINYFNGLAMLHAYVENPEASLKWCKRVENQLAAREREPADWEREQALFTRDLSEAIQMGLQREFLEAKTNQPLQ